MQILLASAKLMHDHLTCPKDLSCTRPLFQDNALRLVDDLRRLSAERLQDLLQCSSQIALQNVARYSHFNHSEELQPAIFSYNGQSYKHLNANTLDDKALTFAQDHLWLVSFLYGLLRPFDLIHTYRLEGSAVLPEAQGENLFDYWKPLLTDVLIESVKQDDGVLLYLATEEFTRMFDWRKVCSQVRVVRPVFQVEKGGKPKVQAVWAKTCRGAMTLFVLNHRLSEVERLPDFAYEGFTYVSDRGDEDHPHFLKIIG